MRPSSPIRQIAHASAAACRTRTIPSVTAFSLTVGGLGMWLRQGRGQSPFLRRLGILALVLFAIGDVALAVHAIRRTNPEPAAAVLQQLPTTPAAVGSPAPTQPPP